MLYFFFVALLNDSVFIKRFRADVTPYIVVAIYFGGYPKHSLEFPQVKYSLFFFSVM